MKIKFLVFFTFLSLNIFAQLEVAPNKYYFELTDKNHNLYSLDSPEEFLSFRALQRRANQNIMINYSDLPVSQFYIDSIRNCGVEILNVSKWFNSVLVYSENPEPIELIKNLSFVSGSITYEIKTKDERMLGAEYKVLRDIQKGEEGYPYYNYGPSQNQIFMHNGQKLHNKGYRGQGMLIAVIDAGFTATLDVPSLQHVFQDNRVIATRNFVHGGDSVFNYSTHGMRVFSILAGNSPYYLVGSAPEAEYVLLMSEDPITENLIEEINWISAAEFADSIGTDIVNVSLGYLTFDMPVNNHSYEDMDGETTIIALAAREASHKGMLLVVSAANSGESQSHPWIASPGDAKDIITAGAVYADSTYAAFSSIGPSYDGRIKPDLVAMGAGTFNQEPNGGFGYGNGTSFSAPLLAGMFACLWQQFPEKTNFEIMEIAKQTANLYNNPNAYLGYGIPDFDLASQILTVEKEISKMEKLTLSPNPYYHDFNIHLDNNIGDEIVIEVSDLLCRKHYLWFKLRASENNQTVNIPDLANLKPSIYIVTVSINSKKYSAKLIKQ